ncbi:hypothetical protein STSP2_00355 [Anaerohalosphaera lusitana]|uniref:Uncharacterized protein n=1 Tax=Anaerohalosphaera lusitana TaxID=1936003 RepID=A0A1U9NH03_9BACT|nr:hypothetical protein [Anaerohalosphaera lusitana]AQT67212.1 hypothetical protein STSP2_00355 [Anaerohalosphaera lusitana]
MKRRFSLYLLIGVILYAISNTGLKLAFQEHRASFYHYSDTNNLFNVIYALHSLFLLFLFMFSIGVICKKSKYLMLKMFVLGVLFCLSGFFFVLDHAEATRIVSKQKGRAALTKEYGDRFVNLLSKTDNEKMPSVDDWRDTVFSNNIHSLVFSAVSKI